MAVQVSAVRLKAAHKPAVDGARVHNTLLHDLPAGERGGLLSRLEFVNLPTRTLLHEAGRPIQFAYFVNSGLVSIVTVMSDGKSVEVGLTGKEGFVGLPLIAGYGTSATRAIVQIASTAFRMPAREMPNALQTFPKLDRILQRYGQELAVQSAQVAACNRLHEVEERLARWLLMSQDRVGSPNLALTQETLSHMLGTRRASVTVAAGILQKAGLISYRRGHVKIKDRRGLERAACECYETISRQVESWKKPRRAAR